MIKRRCSDINALLRCKKAQAMVEYSLILAFVCIIAQFMYYNIEINADGDGEVQSFRFAIEEVFYHVSNMMKNAMSSM